jgi:two-component system, chemotaxis family, protein-glutamate methylesterase/glutaminase
LPERDIVVIGGSAGSVKALHSIVGGLPQDFPASIFVVVHISAEFHSNLHMLLAKWGALQATQAVNGEPDRRRHIYVARPDYHLTLESGVVCVRRGPCENRHRPAIDPLFRTAARSFGPRAIGVILSGLLDDGAAGLYAIKERGGIAIVQDPADAFCGEMPSRARDYAHPQYVLPAGDIAPCLVKLVSAASGESVMRRSSTKIKSAKASRAALLGRREANDAVEANVHTAYNDEGEGKPSVFACPECHGVLWELKNGKLLRFRCRVGHSYTSESLAIELSHASESALWAAMRALEEKAAMQRRIADANGGIPASSRLLAQSMADDAHAKVIRDMIFKQDARLGPLDLKAEAQAAHREPTQRKRQKNKAT